MLDSIFYWTGLVTFSIFAIIGAVIILYIAAHFIHQRLRAIYDMVIILDAIKLYRQSHPEKFKDESH